MTEKKSDNTIIDEKVDKPELTDEELDEITGGVGGNQGRTVKARCDHCKKVTTFQIFSGGRGRCQVCNNMKYDL